MTIKDTNLIDHDLWSLRIKMRAMIVGLDLLFVEKSIFKSSSPEIEDKVEEYGAMGFSQWRSQKLSISPES